MRTLIVVGAGGFGREVLDVVDAINADSAQAVWQPIVVDDAPSDASLERIARRGATFGGGVDEALEARSGAAYVVAVGSPSVRRRIVDRFDNAGFEGALLRHPHSTVGREVSIGPGSILCAGVRVATNVAIGSHVHLNPNVTVGHDSTVGDFVSVNPGVAISGECVIEAGALLGSGAVVINGLTVGRDSVVGAAACVARDVGSCVTVKGVPAR